jgi:hypothetical protein
LLYGLAPVGAGLALDAALAFGTAPLLAYRVLFVAAATATLLSYAPLRAFRS